MDPDGISATSDSAYFPGFQTQLLMPTSFCTGGGYISAFPRGNAEMYRRSGLVISREQGLRYDAGFAVPVLMS